MTATAGMDLEHTGTTTRPRVVVVGAGFGGLRVIRGLRKSPVDVVVIDKVNHHLFQPLLYQVSTALLPPGDIAPPIRGILADQNNARVILGEVKDIDVDAKTVAVAAVDGRRRSVAYDYLVVAAGSHDSYFGHDEWAEVALPMKSLDHAVDLRSRLLRAFEIAAVTDDHQERHEWLSFVVVGAGPTGVELAGQIAALARDGLKGQYHDLDPTDLSIVLADAAPYVLPPFPEELRAHTRRHLETLGIEVVTGMAANQIDEHGVTFKPVGDAGGEERRIAARTVIWAAGVKASELARLLAEKTGAELDRRGRLIVNKDATVGRHSEIYAVGDMVNLNELPSIAEPALQAGIYVGRSIRAKVEGRPPKGPFKYHDLGTMATISPTDAVADVRGLHLKGPIGKLAWAVVHLAFLVGWGNRVSVLTSWSWMLATGRRRQRVIVSERERKPFD